jgi:SAM-dependent methyltransferase
MQQLARMRGVHPGMKVAFECERTYVDRWLATHSDVARPTVLEAGRGFQYGLVMHYPDRFDVLGIEMDETTLRKNRDVTWRVVGDAMRLPAATGAFDLIFCRDVLEHLPFPTRTLEEFARVLKPDGLAVITTVNVLNPGMWAIRLTPRSLRKAVRAAS